MARRPSVEECALDGAALKAVVEQLLRGLDQAADVAEQAADVAEQAKAAKKAAVDYAVYNGIPKPVVDEIVRRYSKDPDELRAVDETIRRIEEVGAL